MPVPHPPKIARVHRRNQGQLAGRQVLISEPANEDGMVRVTAVITDFIHEDDLFDYREVQ